LLENNTFITTDASGVVGDIHCASASTVANVGQWIAPNEADLTKSATDPFDIRIGDQQDPGSLIIQQRLGHIVTRSFQGIYTCIIPDEDGVLQYLRLGIYQNGFNSESFHHAFSNV